MLGQIIISSADAANVRQLTNGLGAEYYNTQGRRYLTPYNPAPPSSFYITANLYVPTLWATSNPTDAALNRRAELWTQISDNNADIASAPFCIIGFVRFLCLALIFQPAKMHANTGNCVTPTGGPIAEGPAVNQCCCSQTVSVHRRALYICSQRARLQGVLPLTSCSHLPCMHIALCVECLNDQEPHACLGGGVDMAPNHRLVLAAD